MCRSGDFRLSDRYRIIDAICQELEKAYSKHGRELWGHHEFYGILKEEVDELWDAIKHDSDEQEIILEALQIAAVCVRYLETGNKYA